MISIMSLLACICIVWVFVQFKSLADGPGMSFVRGIICPQASQTCCDKKLLNEGIKALKNWFLFVLYLFISVVLWDSKCISPCHFSKLLFPILPFRFLCSITACTLRLFGEIPNDHELGVFSPCDSRYWFILQMICFKIFKKVDTKFLPTDKCFSGTKMCSDAKILTRNYWKSWQDCHFDRNLGMLCFRQLDLFLALV